MGIKGNSYNKMNLKRAPINSSKPYPPSASKRPISLINDHHNNNAGARSEDE